MVSISVIIPTCCTSRTFKGKPNLVVFRERSGDSEGLRPGANDARSAQEPSPLPQPALVRPGQLLPGKGEAEAPLQLHPFLGRTAHLLR